MSDVFLMMRSASTQKMHGNKLLLATALQLQPESVNHPPTKAGRAFLPARWSGSD